MFCVLTNLPFPLGFCLLLLVAWPARSLAVPPSAFLPFFQIHAAFWFVCLSPLTTLFLCWFVFISFVLLSPPQSAILPRSCSLYLCCVCECMCVRLSAFASHPTVLARFQPSRWTAGIPNREAGYTYFSFAIDLCHQYAHHDIIWPSLNGQHTRFECLLYQTCVFLTFISIIHATCYAPPSPFIPPKALLVCFLFVIVFFLLLLYTFLQIPNCRSGCAGRSFGCRSLAAGNKS